MDKSGRVFFEAPDFPLENLSLYFSRALRVLVLVQEEGGGGADWLLRVEASLASGLKECGGAACNK